MFAVSKNRLRHYLTPPHFLSRFTSSLRSTSSNEWLKRQLSDPYVRAREAAGYRSRAAFKLAEINERFHILRKGASVVDLGAAPGGWTQVAVDAVGDSMTTPPVMDMMMNNTTTTATTTTTTTTTRSPTRRTRASFFDLSSEETATRTGLPSASSASPSFTSSDLTSSTTAAAAAITTGRRPLVVAVDLEHITPLRGAQMVRGDFNDARTRAAVASALARGRADVILSDMAHAFTGDSGLDHARQMALAWSSFSFALSALRAGGHWCAKVRYGIEYDALRSAASRLFEDCAEVKPPASRLDSAEAFLVGRRLRVAHPILLPHETARLAAHGVGGVIG
jgi:23S rRNA U2552 (ribose-2'-O)-methylase RlmE/FtsJ